MAKWTQPEISPWRRRGLTIPPDSWQDWVRLAVWELWMGALLAIVVVFGTNLIATAPARVVTVFDFSNCYAAPPVALPCERIAYRAGALSVLLNVWCGLLVITVAVWLVWDLWNATTPKPITDDFLKLLDASFGTDWRRIRRWPWARLVWAYGFTLFGAALTIAVVLQASSLAARPPTVHVDTSESFRTEP